MPKVTMKDVRELPDPQQFQFDVEYAAAIDPDGHLRVKTMSVVRDIVANTLTLRILEMRDLMTEASIRRMIDWPVAFSVNVEMLNEDDSVYGKHHLLAHKVISAAQELNGAISSPVSWLVVLQFSVA